jgi:hypothetical protein
MTAVYTKCFHKSDVTFQACEHNTNGTKCDYCVAGYYGDATQGTPLDCQQCACPLVESSNNFSPNCELRLPDGSTTDYICTDCPQGYDGDHCERYIKFSCSVKTSVLCT